MTYPTYEPLRFVRGPASTLDFTIDWSGDLDTGDTIAASSWAPVEDPGLTVVSSSFTDTTTTVTLSGGVAGSGLVTDFYPFSAECTYYHMVNTITTGAGCIDERSMVLVTKDQ